MMQDFCRHMRRAAEACNNFEPTSCHHHLREARLLALMATLEAEGQDERRRWRERLAEAEMFMRDARHLLS